MYQNTSTSLSHDKRTREDGHTRLSKSSREHNDQKDHGKNYKEAASLVARILLVSTGATQFDIRPASVVRDILDIVADNVELAPLLMNNVGDIAKQFVEFADALLNVPDFRLPLDDERFLEIHLVLVRQAGLLLFQLLLELLLLFPAVTLGGLLTLLHGGASSHGRGALLFQRAALDRLELVQSGAKF